MNENSFISQRTHTRVKFRPLTVSCQMVCLTEMSPCAQSVSTLSGAAEYEPDRSLTPTVILPEVRAVDPDGIFRRGNANEFLSTDSDKMIWLGDGEPIADVWTAGEDYSIDISSSDTRGALTIKKNLPANSNVVLTFRGQFLDWRTGITYDVESNEIALTCTEKGTDVIQCSVDKPLVTYDPLYDNLLLWEHKKALGMMVSGTRAEANDGKSYEQEINVLLTKGLKELNYENQVKTSDGFLFRKTANGQLTANPDIAQLTAMRGKSVISNEKILNFNAESLKTVGFNQYNPSTSKAHVLQGVVYHIQGPYTSLSLNGATITPDSSGLFTPASTGYLTVSGGGSNTCINISDPSKNGTYEPYWESNLPLNINTQTGKLNGSGDSVVVFPNGMAGMNGVQDTIQGNTAIKKFMQVNDLTTLPITLNYEGYAPEEESGDTVYSFILELPKNGKAFTASVMNGLFNKKYSASSGINASSFNNFYIYNLQGKSYVEIMDNDFSTDARFADEEQWDALIADIRTSLADKMLLFELNDYENYIIDDFIEITTIKGKLNGIGPSVVVFPYGTKNLGTVKDELTVSAATKKIMTVDLGQCDIMFGDEYRVYDGNNDNSKYYFEVRLPKKAAIGKYSQGRCEKYTGVTTLSYDQSNTFSISSELNIIDSRYAFDDRMADEDLFEQMRQEIKDYLSGVMFDYELDEHEDYVLDRNIGLPIKVNYLGTEEVIQPEGTAPTSTVGEMYIEYSTLNDGIKMRIVKLGTSTALEPNSETSPELTEALYPTIKFDMRMIDSGEYEVQFVKDGEIVARATIGLNRETTMPASGQGMFSADIVPNQNIYRNTALLQLRDRVVEFPELYYLLRWFTQTQYNDNGTWRYKDALPWQHGENLAVKVSDIGMGVTKNDSWFDYWFECDAHKVSELVTDENGVVLVDENGEYLID